MQVVVGGCLHLIGPGRSTNLDGSSPSLGVLLTPTDLGTAFFFTTPSGLCLAVRSGAARSNAPSQACAVSCSFVQFRAVSTCSIARDALMTESSARVACFSFLAGGGVPPSRTRQRRAVVTRLPSAPAPAPCHHLTYCLYTRGAGGENFIFWAQFSRVWSQPYAIASLLSATCSSSGSSSFQQPPKSRAGGGTQA